MVRKEEILARTSNGLDVFRHYLPVKWRVGRNFLNPLYEDSKASCNVYYDRRSGTIKSRAKVLITISIDTDNNPMVVYSSKVVSLSGNTKSAT